MRGRAAAPLGVRLGGEVSVEDTVGGLGGVLLVVRHEKGKGLDQELGKGLKVVWEAWVRRHLLGSFQGDHLRQRGSAGGLNRKRSQALLQLLYLSSKCG